MTTASLSRTVGDLVAERPSRARIFERFGIDYCCGGKLSLDQACAKKAVDRDRVLAELAAADAAPAPERNWVGVPLAELADHIEATHHAMLKQELPRLSAMTRKVAKVHGADHPELVRVAEIFESFAAEMIAHMGKEERVLFPMIRALERGEAPPPGSPHAMLGPITVMEREHDDAGRAMEQMRELTSGFRPPLGACGTYRATLDGLAQLEADLHIHVHKENSILFPGAAELERRRA
jgi:regulator of cell morphogenesis and NO signaling